MSHHKLQAGYLYVVATQSGAVKFGISKDPKTRVKAHHRSMGTVSPISFSWISQQSLNYKEVEADLISIYGSEYLRSADPEEIKKHIEDSIISIDQKPSAPRQTPEAAKKHWSERTSDEQYLVSQQQRERAVFVLNNSDRDLRSYLLVPVLFSILEKDCENIPTDMRDKISNRISEFCDEELASFLTDFCAGGYRQECAIDSAGLTASDFEFEAQK